MTASATILIVDDEPLGREVLSALLHNQGYQLLFAANGAEAIASATAHQPDLILLDVMMGDMDGFEVCRRLRTNATLAEVPIILVTALDERESRLEGIAAGADDFVTKPFDRAELRLRVQTITRLNRYRRLLEERSRLSWVVEHSDDGYLLLDQHDVISYANARARQYLDLDRIQTALDTPFLEFVTNGYRCEPQNAWEGWPNLSDEAAATTRYLVHPETQTAQALWLQVEVIDQGDATRLIQLRNVTTQMGLQHDTWTFHTSILHKFRTPLSSIIVSMNLITQRLGQQSDVMLTQMSEIALRGAERLNDQVNEILGYIQASKLGMVTGRCPVGAIPALIQEIGMLMGLGEIMVTLNPVAASMILVLPRQTLELILIELFSNSKKFHPEQQPHIQVAITPISDDAINLAVSDDGSTLSPDQLAHVWLPYYQAEKYFTGEVRGMGLGLTMVATRLWSVNGSVHIMNQDNGPGVVVTLTIPCPNLTRLDDGVIVVRS